MTTRRATTALIVLAVSGSLVACGDNASEDAGPASVDAGSASGESEGSSDGASDGDGQADREDAALEFAECMRENGVEVETQVGENGGVGTGMSGGGSGDGGPTPEEMDAAHAECEDHLPGGGEREPVDPDEVARRQDQALALAECMRDRGYDFPDPQVDDSGGVRIQAEPPGQGAPGTSAHDEFEADMEECHDEAGMAVPGEDGGPSPSEEG